MGWSVPLSIAALVISVASIVISVLVSLRVAKTQEKSQYRLISIQEKTRMYRELLEVSGKLLSVHFSGTSNKTLFEDIKRCNTEFFVVCIKYYSIMPKPLITTCFSHFENVIKCCALQSYTKEYVSEMYEKLLNEIIRLSAEDFDHEKLSIEVKRFLEKFPK